MSKNDFAGWDKSDLIKEIQRLKKRKKFGLVWEDKPEDVVEKCKNELPVLQEIKKNAIVVPKNDADNLLIEGDNYHALSVLNYTHKGKVDVIYIDPPYNTGAKDWKYNNDYVDINDRFRHSKWLSMMNNRLRISKDLLKKDGVLIAMIDKNENGTLLMLLKELFPAHDITTVVIEHNPKGLPSRNFSDSHEYAHFVIPKGLSVIGKNPETKEDTRNLRRAGKASFRKERKSMFYPIYVKAGKVVRIGSVPADSFHPSKRAKKLRNGEIEIWPIDDAGRERRWHFGLDSIEDHIERIEVRETEDDCQLYVTAVPGRYKTVWTGGEFDAGKYGTTLVKDMVGVEFPFPKSLYATAKCLETVIYNRENALVLDYFAGSGTTGHAVLHLNDKYKSNHRFILCTNNENNISETITHPRLTAAIKGYKTDKSKIPGLRSTGIRYYRTSFVAAASTDKNKVALTLKATEMLCIKESTYSEVYSDDSYKIFSSGDKRRFTGIIYDHLAIDAFKKRISKLEGKFSVYIFSLGDDSFDDEFNDLRGKVKLSPIPEAILRVYRRIFK